MYPERLPSQTWPRRSIVPQPPRPNLNMIQPAGSPAPQAPQAGIFGSLGSGIKSGLGNFGAGVMGHPGAQRNMMNAGHGLFHGMLYATGQASRPRPDSPLIGAPPPAAPAPMKPFDAATGQKASGGLAGGVPLPGGAEKDAVLSGLAGGFPGNLGVMLRERGRLADGPSGGSASPGLAPGSGFPSMAAKSPDTPPTTAQPPATAGATAAPQGSLEAMLMQRMKASMSPANYAGGGPSTSFNVAGPVDPSGMYNFPMPFMESKGRHGTTYGSHPLGSLLGFQQPFAVPQQPLIPPGGPSPREMQANDFSTSLSALLGIKEGRQKHEAAMGENQARTMAAQAEMRKAETATHPAVLESQFPGISDAMKFPGIGDTPAAKVLEQNQGAGVQDYLDFFDKFQRLMPENQKIREYVRQKMLRFSPEQLKGAGEPTWGDNYLPWGDGGAAAGRSRSLMGALGYQF